MNEEFKHSFKNASHDALGLSVYNCGIQRCGSGHSWGPAMRDHYLIHYILSGRGVYDDGATRHELQAGDGFLITPSRLTSYTADEAEPWEYCWVGFNGSDAQRLISLTGLSDNNPVFHYEKDGQLRTQLEAIVASVGPRPCDEARMLAGLLTFLSTLMEQFGNSLPHRSSGYEYVRKSIQFIDFNFSRDIDIDDIASHAGISRSHLYRLFMQYVSMPPNEYLTRFRINKAAALLRSNNLSVGEAAYSTGFSDQLYFSRVFKKYKGVPPSRYLQSGSAVPDAERKE
jgi:AraC-like DNA-binding protein